ncbi:MAG: SPFH domain-containing protein [Capsulimonadaceae bacterium]
MKRFITIVLVIAVIAGIVIANSSGFIVKTGNVGLVVDHLSGQIDPHVRHAGFNPQPPFSMKELIEIPTYERTYTMVRDSSEGAHSGDDSVVVNTLSSNSLNVDTSVTYHIAYDSQHPERIISLYQKYRNQFAEYSMFEESQLRPAFRQAVVDAFGSASTTDDLTGDGKRRAAAYALKELNDRFNPDSIVVDDVRIRAVYPDQTTIDVLRSRLQAQQNLKLAQLNLQLQQLVNQKAVMAAQAEAQAAHIRAASLTPRLVRFRHIQDLDIVGVPKGAIVDIQPEESSSGDQVQTGQQ